MEGLYSMYKDSIGAALRARMGNFWFRLGCGVISSAWDKKDLCKAAHGAGLLVLRIDSQLFLS